jgi:hypothetical protein
LWAVPTLQFVATICGLSSQSYEQSYVCNKLTIFYSILGYKWERP